MKLLLIILSVLVSCQNLKPLKTEATHLSFFDNSEIDEKNDFLIKDKKDFNNFLNLYFKSEDIENDKLLSSHKERDITAKFIENGIQNNKNFQVYFPFIQKGTLFNFYSSGNNLAKTLVYIHDTISTPYFMLDYATRMKQYFKDYNIVIVDVTAVLHNNTNFSTEELNLAFTNDMIDFINTSKIKTNQLFFNVICHSTMMTNDFFINHANKYAKVIYYTPMVIKAKNDNVPNLNLIFNDEAKQIELSDLLYFFYKANKNYIQTIILPKKHQYINAQTERNLIESYFKGTDFNKIKKKSLIYGENEQIMTLESYQIEAFEVNQTEVIKKMSHADYYANKDFSLLYFKSLENLINKL